MRIRGYLLRSKGVCEQKKFGKHWVRWLCRHNSWEAGLSVCHTVKLLHVRVRHSFMLPRTRTVIKWPSKDWPTAVYSPVSVGRNSSLTLHPNPLFGTVPYRGAGKSLVWAISHCILFDDSFVIYIYTYIYTRVGNLIVATIYLQLIQNRYMFRSFTVLQCSHQHCVQPVSSDVEVVGYL